MASSASARPRIRPARVPFARLRTTSTCLSVNGRVTERASNEHADRVCFAQQRNRKPSVEEPRTYLKGAPATRVRRLLSFHSILDT